MKKTLISAIILAAALVSLASCGKDNTDETGEIQNINLTSEYNYSAGITENGFFEGVVASEIVTLPEYKGIEMTKEELEGSEAALQEQIDLILAEHTSYEQIKDGVVADGDTLNIDYVGSINGVEFQGGNTGGQGTLVTIGVTQYIDDFLEQLIGHKPGENFNIEVTFPENYGNEELNGKDAIFNITINYIQGEEIKAELNDEIAEYYGFDSVEALKDDIRKWLKTSAAFTAFTNVVENTVCEEYPESVINYFVNSDKYNIEYSAKSQNITADEYAATYLGAESVDAYIEANKEYYEESALGLLVAQAIAELEGITVTDEDVIAAGYDQYVSYYGSPYVKQVLLYQELIPTFIADNAVAVEAE